MASVTGNITANGQSVAVPLARRDVSAKIVMTGTYAGLVVAFETTADGTTWVPAVGVRVDSAGSPAGTFTASTNGAHAWIIPCRGMAQVRVRATGFTSGTAVVRIMPDDAPAPAYGVSTVDTELPAAASLADATANPNTVLVGSANETFNGSTWDRQRGVTTPQTVDTSSARTSSGTGVTFTNYNGRGVIVYVNVTAVSGTTPTATFRLQESYDGTNWRDIDTTNLQTASITAAALAKLEIGPGLATAANASRNALAPRLLRVAWTIGGTTPSFTFVSYFVSTV